MTGTHITVVVDAETDTAPIVLKNGQTVVLRLQVARCVGPPLTHPAAVSR